MIWTLLCVAADIHVTETTHIPGTDNDKCDQLSRRGPTPTTTIAQHAALLGLGAAPDISLRTDTDVVTLISLCKPSLLTKTDPEFSAYWRLAQETINNFVSRHKPTSQPSTMLFPTLPSSLPILETDPSPTPIVFCLS